MINKKILFNCSTNIKGGTLQNAANFIITNIQSKNQKYLEYFYLVSPEVNELIKSYKIDPDKLFIILNSPSKSIYSRFQIKRIASQIKPDLVFTMAGPAYVNFKSLHLMGCSNPYVLFASPKDIFFGRSFVEFFLRYVHTQYQLYYIKKATHFVFQSISSRDELSKKILVKNSFVIPNAIGVNTRNLRIKSLKNKKYFQNGKLKILCPFARYPHKGFHILPALVKQLKENDIDVHLVVTISEKGTISNKKDSRVQNNNISFIGEQKYSDMIDLYEQCDLVFMPSVLEVFSSVCIEALYYQKPLIVANRGFNIDVVGKYAFFCDPYSINSCLEAIKKAKQYVNDKNYLSAGKKQVTSKFGHYKERHKSITETIRSIFE